MLVPTDPNDDRNVIVEVRAGTGGEEASLFAADLYRMYARYAERRRWKVEVMSTSDSESGGFKEIIAEVRGDGAYSRLKFESGVHRVQRVPSTEAQGRIHTSTATVSVLPEADEVEVQIDEKDLRIDVYRSSGPGGQSVNTTDSAVRITHLPTGLVVAIQDEKSQHKNRAKAMSVLRARLLEQEQERQAAERGEERRSQVGSGERSEKIRTYNFPDDRVTDHRFGVTVHNLPGLLEGDLDRVIEPLLEADQARRLEELGRGMIATSSTVGDGARWRQRCALRDAGQPTPRLDAEVLLAHVTGRDRTWLLAHPEAGFEEGDALSAAVERRAAGEPVAYIRGFKEWRSLRIRTDARALIPRPETELVVATAAAEITARLSRQPTTVAWDVATGSGADRPGAGPGLPPRARRRPAAARRE